VIFPTSLLASFTLDLLETPNIIIMKLPAAAATLFTLLTPSTQAFAPVHSNGSTFKTGGVGKQRGRHHQKSSPSPLVVLATCSSAAEDEVRFFYTSSTHDEMTGITSSYFLTYIIHSLHFSLSCVSTKP
jgi:hypothetical protein